MKTPIFILRNAWNMEVKIQKSFNGESSVASYESVLGEGLCLLILMTSDLFFLLVYR